MELTLTSRGDLLIVRVYGAVESRTSGKLYDTLAAAFCEGWSKLIVDLSQATELTHAGLRGVIVAARLLRSVRGEMRLCVADDRAQAMLIGLGFNHLIKCQPSIEAAQAAMSPNPHDGESEAAEAPGAAYADAWGFKVVAGAEK